MAIVVRFAHQPLQRRLDQPLRVRVERAGRLVQDQDARVLQDHARDGDALLLAAGELVAALADHRVVALRAAPRCGRGSPPRAPRASSSSSRGVGLGVAQVLADRRVEEVRLLRHHADHLAQALQRHVAHVVAVDRHGAAVDVVEARHEIGDRRLAGAAGADQRRRAGPACTSNEMSSSVGPLGVGRVAERHMVERHLAAHRRRGRARAHRACRRSPGAYRDTRRCGRRAPARPAISTCTFSSCPIGKKSAALQRGEGDQRADDLGDLLAGIGMVPGPNERYPASR